MTFRTYTRRGSAVGGGEAAADVIWTDSLVVDDLIHPKAKWFDTFEAADFASAHRPKLFETLDVGESVIVTLAPTWAEAVAVDVFFKPSMGFFDTLDMSDFGSAHKARTFDTLGLEDGAARSVQVGGLTEGANVRESSFTARLSPVFIDSDAWTDEANPAVNHGTDVELQAFTNLAVGSQGKRAYLKFDFRNGPGQRFENMVAVPGDLGVAFAFAVKQGDVVLAKAFDLYARISATDPFDEATLTWNNQPALGTLQQNLSVGPGGVYEEENVALDSNHQVDDVLGNWLQLAMTVDSNLVLSTFTFRSSDESPVVSPPRLGFILRRAV